MSKRTPVLPASVLLALLLLSHGGAFGAEPPEASDARERIAQIVPQVEEIRGLPFERRVPVEIVGAGAVSEYANRRIDKFGSPEDLAAESRAYEVLGMLPPGTSVLRDYTAALEEGVAGYYDPDRKEFFLRGDLASEVGSIFAAHELTHALEDQYYDLDARIAGASDDGDRGFAVMAVHEGSASLLMAVYVARALESGSMKRESLEALAVTEEARGVKLRSLEPMIRRPLLGAYVLGTRFLLRGKTESVGRSGYPIEDAKRCYEAGPVSSEQILHPEKYWDPRRVDLPRAMVLPDAAPVLGAGWKRAVTGTLGELLLGPLVGAPTPESWSAESIRGEGWTNDAAAGWGGDRFALWTRGDDAIVLLTTSWDSARDAREFERALPVRGDLRGKRSGDRVAVIAGRWTEPEAKELLRAMLRAR